MTSDTVYHNPGGALLIANMPNLKKKLIFTKCCPFCIRRPINFDAKISFWTIYFPGFEQKNKEGNILLFKVQVRESFKSGAGGKGYGA